MKRITIATPSPYDIIIDSGALSHVGELILEKFTPRKVCIIADSTAGSLYSDMVSESLKNSGFTTCKILFPAGEHSKNLTTYANIVEAMASENLSRTDIVMALGGGVVSDIAGFAAGTYMRGVSLIQVPTTLLAAMDASVGGKAAINLLCGKNLAGIFWEPALVICDPDTFNDLPESKLTDALAEATKNAVVSDRSLLTKIKERDLKYIVERSISIKKSLIEVDERDMGLRRLLSFGHTIGHGIEKLSSYNISHGRAVAKGMVGEARASFLMGYTDTDISGELTRFLEDLGLDLRLNYDPEELYKLTLMDKKIEGDTITMVIPENMGKCTLRKISLSELHEFMIKACD